MWTNQISCVKDSGPVARRLAPGISWLSSSTPTPSISSLNVQKQTTSMSSTTTAEEAAKAAALAANQEKSTEADFRTYDDDTEQRVIDHYTMMRTHQTLAFYERMEDKYDFDNYRALMTIEEAFDKLEDYVDASDPDLDLPNKLHLLQTAEGIRNAGHPDWMQLTGLLHDMGKIMFLWGTGADGQDGTAYGPQWALGGDTWVVGCRIPDEVILPHLNRLNPDMQDAVLGDQYGIYSPHCGLDQLKFAWGHDEYMYRMLVANESSRLPSEALDMIRYHSAYPLHDRHAYDYLLVDSDMERLEYIKLFNKFDLYTKDGDNALDVEEVWPYYRGLLEKYGLDGKLKW